MPALINYSLCINHYAIVLAVYFNSVGIKNIRHALACGIIADCAGIISAIFIAYWFFVNVSSPKNVRLSS